MLYRRLLGAIALSTTLWAPTAGAQIFDLGKYPTSGPVGSLGTVRSRPEGTFGALRAARLQRDAL